MPAFSGITETSQTARLGPAQGLGCDFAGGTGGRCWLCLVSAGMLALVPSVFAGQLGPERALLVHDGVPVASAGEQAGGGARGPVLRYGAGGGARPPGGGGGGWRVRRGVPERGPGPAPPGGR